MIVDRLKMNVVLSGTKMLQRSVATGSKPFRCMHRAFTPSRRHLVARAGAADTTTLPLAGIKVLDMTRVLAGVSSALQCQTLALAFATNTVTSRTVRKY